MQNDDWWQTDPSGSGRLFTLRVIGAFDIVELDETISSYASDAGTPIASRLAALRTLREIASEEVDTLVRLATSHESPGAMREMVCVPVGMRLVAACRRHTPLPNRSTNKQVLYCGGGLSRSFRSPMYTASYYL